MNSELRQDIISGDWIVIAPKRKSGHMKINGKKTKRPKTPIKDCPFENPQKGGNAEPILIYPRTKQSSGVGVYPNKDEWCVQIIENKYPAFTHKKVCVERSNYGPYAVMEAIGRHDLVITRDHHKNFPKLDKKEANLLFQAFIDYYQTLSDDPCLAYVSIYHNWGAKAGATVYHPHYQIIALPIIPPDVEHSLEGSLNYYEENKKCVHCVMLEWELKEKKRIIYENKEAIAFTPFVSREPFEIRVFPKKHFPFIEETSADVLEFVIDALQKALIKLEKHLNEPDYNFFIHTAPLKDKEKHKHYHWHIEILPKISISAGFELGTGIEITAVDPDEAAKILK